MILRQIVSALLPSETPWGPVRFTMPFVVLPGGGNAIIVGQNTSRNVVGISVMGLLKASVLNAYGRQDGSRVELTARAV